MTLRLLFAASVATLVALAPLPAAAHCDTVDGPVVKDARAALAAQDVTPVLKWVSAEKEGEIQLAFAHAVAVRGLGADARALADRFFFETLVRVHREGEGAPYTGLRPAGAEIEPGIAAADQALETGAADALVSHLTREVEHGLRARFTRVIETRKHATHDVAHGREFVAAYVDFIHYAEGLVTAAKGPASHAAHAAPPAAAHAH